MLKVLQDYLAAAEANLKAYEAGGDERAIRAGKGMVERLKADIANLKGA